MRNKINMIILIALFFISNQAIIAQEITAEKKQEIISNLAIIDSMGSRQMTSRHAIIEVIDYKVYEAIPAILQNIWKQEPYDQVLFLTALNVLNYENVCPLTLAFIDSVDHLDISEEPNIRLEMKSKANTILFDHGDFSKRQNTYDYSQAIFPETDNNTIIALVSILEKYSKNEFPAKNELIHLAQNCTSRDNRWITLGFLYQIYGEEILPLAEQRLIDEKDSAIKVSIIYRIVGLYKNERIHKLFMNQVLKDTSDDVKDGLIECLLIDYATPNDYKIVKEAETQISDDIYKNYVQTRITAFRAFPVDSNSTTKTLIDTLFSYHAQCASFNWVGDTNFSTELQSIINDAMFTLNNGDSLGAAIKIKQYQSLINEEYKDSLDNDGKFVTSDGYKFLYYYPQYILERLPSLPTVKLINSTGTKLTGGFLQYYEGSWKDAVNNNDGTFTVPTTLKTVSLRMNYAYGSQTKSNVTVGADTVIFQTVNATVQLKNSLGNLMPAPTGDAGTVQYYSGAWREFGTTTNGVAAKELLPNNYSFRMSYAFGSNDEQQNIGVDPTVIFQTVNAVVQLKNSLGNLMPAPTGDAGTVQYYSGAWRELGTTTSGVVTKELLPNNYSFRMSYAFASNDKQQNIGADPTVIFQTVNATVQLKNSLGNFIDIGTVQYYSGAWREFGTTTNGVVTKELLPNNYSFRMSYAFASNDKQQNIDADPTVVFQTVNTTVQLKNSLGNLMPAPTGDAGTVQYYSGAWREFGTTTNGAATKELLPNNYSFRISYAFASNDKQQNVGTNPTVVFQTVNTTVQLKNSLGNPIDIGTVQYYSGAWRAFGITTNGIVAKELLPNNYSFRMTHEFISNDKAQNIGINNIVEFNTVLCNVNVTDNQNQPVNNAIVSYYSGAWRSLGNTLNGTAVRELLPANLTFRAVSGSRQADKTQNILTNNVVEIKLP